MSDPIWGLINNANMIRLRPCNICGDPEIECNCPKCEKCGETTCDHMHEKAMVAMVAWGEAIRREQARREAEGKEGK